MGKKKKKVWESGKEKAYRESLKSKFEKDC
jgi:hypothetical protein